MPGSEYIHTMVATLGGQPQIITFTLDLLLRNNFPIREVFVIHPQATDLRIQHSLACLKTQFIDNRYQIDGRTIDCRFASRILRLNNIPFEDIVDDASAIGAHDTIYHLIRELKRQQRIIHLSATGGRRVMSLLAISAAQLNFKHIDHIWHLYTPPEFRQLANEGAIMHASPEDGVRLIKVPFVPWGDYFPYLPQSPDDIARAMQGTQMDPRERERCDAVVKTLTRAELQTLRAFAKGLKRKQVAEELCLSLKTIDTHKTEILKACQNTWQLGSDQPIDYHFLKEHFARYFDKDEYTSS